MVLSTVSPLQCMICIDVKTYSLCGCWQGALDPWCSCHHSHRAEFMVKIENPSSSPVCVRMKCFRKVLHRTKMNNVTIRYYHSPPHWQTLVNSTHRTTLSNSVLGWAKSCFKAGNRLPRPPGHGAKPAVRWKRCREPPGIYQTAVPNPPVDQFEESYRFGVWFERFLYVFMMFQLWIWINRLTDLFQTKASTRGSHSPANPACRDQDYHGLGHVGTLERKQIREVQTMRWNRCPFRSTLILPDPLSKTMGVPSITRAFQPAPCEDKKTTCSSELRSLWQWFHSFASLINLRKMQMLSLANANSPE